MLSMVTSLAVILLITVDVTICSENVLVDQIADESQSQDYHNEGNSLEDSEIINKYEDSINKNYSSIDYSNSANETLYNVNLETSYNRNVISLTNITVNATNIPPKRKNKFVFPKLNPMPDLTGWITVIPLGPLEDGKYQRHGLFRIGRYQNGQYYLNPIRRPGKNLYSSGGVTPLTLPVTRKYLRKYKSDSYRSNRRILNKNIHSGFSNIDLYQDSNFLPLQPFYSEDSIATESRLRKHVVPKIKIKHHHHHHHHKYLKTIVKKVPVKVYVEKPYIVEKPVAYPVEKLVEKVVQKNVPVYIKQEVKVPYPVKVPQPYPVKVVQKEYVAEPYPVVQKVPVIKEVKVPVHHHIHHTVEKKVPYPVRVPVQVKVPYPVEYEKKILYPVKIYVPKPYPVEKLVPQPIIKHLAVPIYVEKPSLEQHDPVYDAISRMTPQPIPVLLSTATSYSDNNQLTLANNQHVITNTNKV